MRFLVSPVQQSESAAHTHTALSVPSLSQEQPFGHSHKHPCGGDLCGRIPCGSDGKESARKAGNAGLTWVRSLGGEDPLEKEMATHSSVLARKTPWSEEPGRLQSMGFQRVGHY